MAARILNLKDDDLLEILENLDYKSLLACQMSCRRLKTLVAESISLQYTIELAACGMVDGPRGSSTLDVTERLRRLRLYDAAWRHLEWTGHTALPHLVDHLPPLMASRGALLFQTGDVDDDESDVDDDEPKDLLQQISSELRGVKERSIFFPVRTGYNVLLDPSQDLLTSAPVSSHPPPLPHRCQLLSLFTGEAHPLSSALDPCADIGERTLIEICGDHILEAIQPNPDLANWDYYVWNWKTGHIVLTTPSTTYNSSMRQHARFLDNNRILVLETGEWHEGKVGCIHVLSIPSTPPGNIPQRPIHAEPSGHAFMLPKFVQEDPGPLTVFLAYGCPHSESNSGYFHSDPDERLLSIRVDNSWYPRASEGPDHVFIDIPLQTFRSYIATHPLSGDSLTVPWDEWRHGARVTRHDSRPWMGHSDLVSTSGMRRINLRRSGEGSTAVLELLDYHPRRVARAIARQRDGSGEVLFHSDKIEGEVYDDLQTALPCLVKQIPLPDKLVQQSDDEWVISGCLCEDGIIFMTMGPISGSIAMAWEYSF
ncbi:hypothetical protein BV25DRAFT_1914990 [Artomyces pyxidatus]|uniref:Uncharacterized protein n=1 Tax=Artomyces pyxidatus TaxID=48021 RepID=A0ACB8T5A6_9AGAM|nr:hypothetical protein BV25DRAFT_1914990 [Artomyces pyxidatus]